jgi:hypothetical protein
MPKPIARVRAGDDPPIVLVLGDDLRWTCDRFPELAEACNLICEGSISCEWAGQPRYAAADKIAKMLHGWIEYGEPKPQPMIVYITIVRGKIQIRIGELRQTIRPGQTLWGRPYGYWKQLGPGRHEVAGDGAEE